MNSELSVEAYVVSGQTAEIQGQRMFALGLLVLRVTFGLVFLLNGIAKLPGQWDGIHPFPGFLITWDGARGILEYNVQTHPVAPYKWLIDNVVLEHYTVFGALLVATELAVGVCLLLGAFTPLAALIGVLFALHINFSTWDRNAWMFEGAVEWGPLLALALMRGGRRVWGLDSRLAARYPRWPFT